MKPSTHYFKESIVRDGVRYQHVIGLNEEYDWRLILDLTDNPAWQLVTVKKPSACRFPREKRGFLRLFEKRAKYRCPHCHERLASCEDDYPDGRARLFVLPRTAASFEPWHDEETRCPGCGARLGVVLPSVPALPTPARRDRLHAGRASAVR